MKRLIVCCDGTWQSQDNEFPTNVLKIAQAIKPVGQDIRGNLIPQVLYYDPGIGVDKGIKGDSFFLSRIRKVIERIGGGAFGLWIDEKIKEAYLFLCLNYTPGDEIYLFGFSRGAYTVRSLAGLIGCSGLLQRPDISKITEAYNIYRIIDNQERGEKARRFRQERKQQNAEIKLLGCWDTVGALGIPDLIDNFNLFNFINEKHKFHDQKLGSIIQNARHAIAIDEKRKAFSYTPMKKGEKFQGTLKQVLFPGDHGSVGGGTKETLKLANAALKWMAEEASKLGLGLDLRLAHDTYDQQGNYLVDSTVSFNSNSKLGWKGEKLRDLSSFKPNDLHYSVRERWSKLGSYRPENLEPFSEELKYP